MPETFEWKFSLPTSKGHLVISVPKDSSSRDFTMAIDVTKFIIEMWEIYKGQCEEEEGLAFAWAGVASTC